MTTIVAISDTHQQHRKLDLPPGDILVCAGDIGGETQTSLEDFARWLKIQNFEHILVTPGNHDFFTSSDWAVSSKILAPAHLLINQSKVIKGIKFWASPYTPKFGPFVYMLPRGDLRLKMIWDSIPLDTQVLITHGPPHGVLDLTVGIRVAGCELLDKRLWDLPDLRLHIFGHIHEGYGSNLHRPGTGRPETTYANVSVVDENYQLVNEPQVFQL